MKTRSSVKIKQKPKREKEINKQLVIRFPQDIADLVRKNNYNAQISVEFIDDNNAICQIFNEEFNAALVSLPTIVETFRTSDGYHLFKSGEITDILIVYRHGEEPTGISNDFKFGHGLTPPTTDIVAKRKTKQEAIAITHHESFLNDVEYWDLAELQVTALISKEKKSHKTQRKEIFEEPDIDPVILEKVLRKNGYSAFKGYSGFEISQEEVDEFDLSKLDYYLTHPSTYEKKSEQQFFTDSSNKSDSQSDFDNDFENDLNNFDESDANNAYFQDDDKSSQDRSIENTDTVDVSEENVSDNFENERLRSTREKYYEAFNDDTEEEESQDDILHQLNDKKMALLTELENYKIQMYANSSNNLIQQKIKNKISAISEDIQKIDERISNINNE